VTDPIIARFAEACGAVAPLHLRVDLAEGNRRALGCVDMPFTLVGQDDACDVTLTDPDVNPRHAWFQVVGGRVLAVDLGSRSGLAWPGQGTGSGWLDVGVPVRIGPFQVRLCSPVSHRPTHFPLRYSPLQSDPSVIRPGSTFTLEFRNGKRARDRWIVNRLITLVGRASDCKIRLSADDIAAFHCGLVLTPKSLWVVDLSGRGVVVNGERMRVSPLQPGAELWIGRFLIGLHTRADAFASVPEPPLTNQTIGGQDPAPSTDLARPDEDEVPFGIAPSREANAGLPSSHIMADAFELLGPGRTDGVSNPILVSGSGPPPLLHPVEPSSKPIPTQPQKDLATSPVERPGNLEPGMTVGADQDHNVASTVTELLRQLGELHGQMLTQFERSLGLMVRLFACLGPERLPTIQQELARIQELNSELGLLQAELARRAAEKSKSLVQTSSRVVPTSSPSPAATDSTALHDWVADRIGSLQKERQARWQSLVGMFSSVESR
jgi:pSer/pThr/pTyr-binding forkhead associated (FHA) protein